MSYNPDTTTHGTHERFDVLVVIVLIELFCNYLPDRVYSKKEIKSVVIMIYYSMSNPS